MIVTVMVMTITHHRHHHRRRNHRHNPHRSTSFFLVRCCRLVVYRCCKHKPTKKKPIISAFIIRLNFANSQVVSKWTSSVTCGRGLATVFQSPLLILSAEINKQIERRHSLHSCLFYWQVNLIDLNYMLNYCFALSDLLPMRCIKIENADVRLYER
uniref:Uncharacterized protein n=1 Tax=Glossina pallidipes TaxID=7398 RepID=A0A1A9ZJF7_GLOPL